MESIDRASAECDGVMIEMDGDARELRLGIRGAKRDMGVEESPSLQRPQRRGRLGMGQRP